MTKFNVGDEVIITEKVGAACFKKGNKFRVCSREIWDEFWVDHKQDYDKPTYIALISKKGETPYICPINNVAPCKIKSWKNRIGGLQ